MLSFISGALVLAFTLGMIVAELRVFPFAAVRAAAEAARDLHENWRHYLRIRSKYAVRTDRVGGVTVHDPAVAYPGHTFVTGYRDGQFHAFLIDMRGTVEHEWRLAFSEVWPDPPHLDVAPPDFDVSVHGAALLPDGAVVMNFEGLGTVRLDRCSRVLWRVPARTHHAVDALPTGEFLVPAWRRLTRPGPDLPGVRVAEGGWLWEEMILRIDPQGRIVAETSLLERMLASGLEAILYANGVPLARMGHTDDPLHLNDVEVLRADMAAAFPLFAAGDVMVSMRNINMIAVLDRETLLVKWWMTGPFLRQHDPDFLPNGNILVFDNRTGGPVRREFGFSRILEVNPATRRIAWSYAGSEREPFYTDARGKQQPLPNGNVLVTEAQAGRVFEVARGPEGGRIVWEWVNGIGDGSRRLRDAGRPGRGGPGRLPRPVVPLRPAVVLLSRSAEHNLDNAYA
jgi:hypothetical protein